MVCAAVIHSFSLLIFSSLGVLLYSRFSTHTVLLAFRFIYSHEPLPIRSSPGVGFGAHVWYHCRISPPRFLAECRKRRLNQGSLVFLYFMYNHFCFLHINNNTNSKFGSPLSGRSLLPARWPCCTQTLPL